MTSPELQSISHAERYIVKPNLEVEAEMLAILEQAAPTPMELIDILEQFQQRAEERSVPRASDVEIGRAMWRLISYQKIDLTDKRTLVYKAS